MTSARPGDLEALYRRRYGVFLRVATAIVGDEPLAADAVHDGFVRAVRHRRRFRGEGSLEAWVWRIVVNEARKRRARERRLPTPSNNLLLAACGRVESNGRGDDVRAVVATLPERQRLVLFLRYYADLEYEAISEALDIAPGTVAATLHAAHAAIRKQLEEVFQ
jgi:RNA polymerase sigma-70 factor (ECF subfamily)